MKNSCSDLFPLFKVIEAFNQEGSKTMTGKIGIMMDIEIGLTRFNFRRCISFVENSCSVHGYDQAISTHPKVRLRNWSGLLAKSVAPGLRYESLSAAIRVFAGRKS